jgi:hypothetical protein
MKTIACLVAGLAVATSSSAARAQTAVTDTQQTTVVTPDGTSTTTTTTTTEPAIMDMGGATIPPARGNDNLYAYEHTYRKPIGSGIGVGFLVGGGVTNFTDTQVRDRTNLGGGWDVRLIFGTHSWIGLEAAYNGSVNNLNAVGLSGDTKLLGTGVQGLARVNFTRNTPFQPYIVGGAGWKHYALAGDKFNVSGIRNDDNVAEIPMGGGLAYHAHGFMMDARGMYNYALNTSLFTPTGQSGSNGAQLHNWGARVNLGFEF